MDLTTMLKDLYRLDPFEEVAMAYPNISAKDLSAKLDADAQAVWHERGNEVVLLASQIMKPHEKISFQKHPRFVSVFEHKHDFLELTYTMKGAATQIINGKRVHMQQGDITLLDTNVIHTIEPIPMDSLVINILMKEDYFNEQLLTRLSENQVISEFITSAIYMKSLQGRYLSFSLGDNPRIRNYIESVLWELIHPQLGSQEAVKCHMILLFTELMRSFQHESSLQNQNRGSKKQFSVSVFAVIQYISEHYLTQSLEDTAHHFYIHPKYLTRLLKKYTGKSYMEIVQEFRMEKASTLLLNTSMTVHEIAHESGFTNVNQFYKYFKKTYNQTPKEYRKG